MAVQGLPPTGYRVGLTPNALPLSQYVIGAALWLRCAIFAVILRMVITLSRPVIPLVKE